MPTKPQFKENYNIPATFSESTLLLRVFRAGDFVCCHLYTTLKYWKILQGFIVLGLMGGMFVALVYIAQGMKGIQLAVLG